MKLYTFRPRGKKKETPEDHQTRQIFPMLDEDIAVVELTKKTIRRMLQVPRLKSRQIIGLGYALYALDRLPQITPGICTEFSVARMVGNENLSESHYVSFQISDEDFEIIMGGRVHSATASIGSAEIDEACYYFEIEGERETECGLSDIASAIEECFAADPLFYVYDESEIKIDFSDMMLTND